MKSFVSARTVGPVLVLMLAAVVAVTPAAGTSPGPWQSPVRLSEHGVLRDVATADGAAVVTWSAGRSVLVGYRLPGGAWETAEVGRGARPRVAVNDLGQAAVTWRRWADGVPTIRVARRPADGSWSVPTVLRRPGTTPVVAVGPTGVVTVLALGWRRAAPRTTAVLSYTSVDGWSPPLRLSKPDLVPSPALRRSLTVTTTARGGAVAAWKCGRFACVRLPGKRAERTDPLRRGNLALSAPPRGPLFLAMHFSISEVEPGFVFTLLWPHREPTSSVTLDVGDGRGVAGWLSAGADGPLWASTKRSHYWSDYRAVTRHAHGIGEVTLAEPSTGLATWRSAAGRLRIAVKGLGGSWEREAALGEDVEVARLVSDAAGDALLAWSSGGPRPGVYVAARPAG